MVPAPPTCNIGRKIALVEQSFDRSSEPDDPGTEGFGTGQDLAVAQEARDHPGRLRTHGAGQAGHGEFAPRRQGYDAALPSVHKEFATVVTTRDALAALA